MVGTHYVVSAESDSDLENASVYLRTVPPFELKLVST